MTTMASVTGMHVVTGRHRVPVTRRRRTVHLVPGVAVRRGTHVMLTVTHRPHVVTGVRI
ncbi:hypothetical protein [Rathayibacter sp. VKM Ac-2835]|uniref:hypothetical protein n=1 Tax=Rathayibacter sp. VKM Ac-2835 TaxID=2739043 RepID=UPI0020B8D779|nr:hypothetical protein [Rathayibacter sp. VKM Ac-2835]